MSKLYFRIAALFALAVLVLVAAASTEVRAQTPAVDPAATRILQKMTDYLGSLRQFSVQTQNTLEDELDSGHRIDHDISASVIISRPNKLQAERKGDLIDQIFYYDGKWLTLYNPIRQGLRDRAGTCHDRGDARFCTRVARAHDPGRRPGLPQCLPAADAGCDPGQDGRSRRSSTEPGAIICSSAVRGSTFRSGSPTAARPCRANTSSLTRELQPG